MRQCRNVLPQKPCIHFWCNRTGGCRHRYYSNYEFTIIDAEIKLKKTLCITDQFFLYYNNLIPENILLFAVYIPPEYKGQYKKIKCLRMKLPAPSFFKFILSKHSIEYPFFTLLNFIKYVKNFRLFLILVLLLF